MRSQRDSDVASGWHRALEEKQGRWAVQRELW